MGENPLRLKSIHHVHFVVGNARQAAYYYRHAFGFSQAAYAGLETGQRDMASYLLTQNKTRFLLSTPLCSEGWAAAHLHAHGDGVVDIAFHVDDADRAFDEAVRRGAAIAREPCTPRGRSRTGAARRDQDLRRYDPLVHLRCRVSGPFLPGFVERRVEGTDAGILRVDHIVGNVELGQMDEWAGWYSRVLGFTRYHQLRRQGHLDGIQRAHEHRHVRRLACDQVSDQRAGGGPAPKPDSGVSRLLRRAGRPAHRPAHDRHRGHRVEAARQRRRVPARARDLLRRAAATRRRDRRGRRDDPFARHPGRS